MTGFGRHTVAVGAKQITVEIRSLNSKQLDVHLRLPSAFRDKEFALRRSLAEQVDRGKVEVYFTIESDASVLAANRLNGPVISGYMAELKKLAAPQEPTASELLAMALRLPDALSIAPDPQTEGDWAAAEEALEGALKMFHSFREQEGQALASDILTNIASIETGLLRVPACEKERLASLKERLLRGLEGLEYNHDRYEQELIHYLEKLDINEEKVRLTTHLEYFKTTLAEGHGRKLGFIAQELGREINTMGSKANHAALQKIVVGMKDDLEKIKEQILNVY